VATYLLAYHGGGMPDSDEERASVLASWNAWYERLGEAVVDPGNPVAQTRTIDADGSVTDDHGPDPVSGYTIIEADDIDAAVDMAMDCPILANGGRIEVAETFEAM